MHRTNRNIFKRGSKTYYNSARFFPAAVWHDVSILYAFVRTADDFVDRQPAERDAFFRFKSDYRRAWESGVASDNPVIDSFVELQRRKHFDPVWVRSFMNSMEMDLTKSKYESLSETLAYIHGSAEVIGWCMARIMELPEAAMAPAARLGRAMQYINFIRDIAEDLELGRQYLPTADTGLPDLTRETARRQPTEFKAYVRREIERYRQWQQEAVEGYRLIPRRCRIPIKTAADMYQWTAGVIERQPFVVYEKKIKPGKLRIILTGITNILS